MNDLDRVRKRIQSRQRSSLNDHHFHSFFKLGISLMCFVLFVVSVKTGTKMSTYLQNSYNHLLTEWTKLPISTTVSKLFDPYFKNEQETSLAVNQIQNYEWVEKNLYTSSSNEVVALEEGTVIEISEQDLLGKYLIVQGKSGIKTTYGLLDNVEINLYDYLHPGDLIGSYDSQIILIFDDHGKEISYDEAKKIF